VGTPGSSLENSLLHRRTLRPPIQLSLFPPRPLLTCKNIEENLAGITASARRQRFSVSNDASPVRIAYDNATLDKDQSVSGTDTL
jgi:hypothetical protein